MTYNVFGGTLNLAQSNSGDRLDVWKWTSCVKAFESYRDKGGECVHIVTHLHFQSRDKDGSHTIRSTVVKNPMLHENLIALSAIEPELWAI